MAITKDLTLINKLKDESGADVTIYISSAQRHTDSDMRRFNQATYGDQVMIRRGYFGIKVPVGINFQINLNAPILLNHYKTYFQTERDGTEVAFFIYKIEINPGGPKPLGDIEIVEPEDDPPIIGD